MGKLSNKGGRERNREEIGAGDARPSPLVLPAAQNRHATQAKAIPDYNVSRQRTRKLRDSAHDYNLQEILKYVGLNCILLLHQTCPN